METPIISIALLGCDSTHTKLFAEILQSNKLNLGVRIKIKSLWGVDANQANQQARLIGLEGCAKSVEHALDGVDLALVLGRFGNSHFIPARAALSLGIPTFVDKPFTANLAEAVELIELSEKNNTYLTSASALRFANELKPISEKSMNAPLFMTVVAPANCIDLGNDPRFNSVFFYGVHAVEMLLQVMGINMTRLVVSSGPKVVSANIKFENSEASVHLVRGVDEFYQVNWYKESEAMSQKILLDGSYNNNLLKLLINSVLEKKKLVDHANTLLAIKILGAMEKADLEFRSSL